MSAWLIRIVDWGESRAEPTVIRLFAAAESDSRAALVAVQKLTNAAPKQRIETVGPLSEQTVRKLGLEPGRALDLTS
jgi:hypothetical protein